MRDIKIQLYKEDNKGIEGYLTLTETSDFPITKALADIQDISKRKSTTSKSIKIGGTKENNRLLEYLYDVDTVSLTYDIDRIQKCSVIIDGDVFLTNCILQVTDITKVQHNSAYECDIEYTVNIKSNNADFFSIIKNKELTDLKFGPNEFPFNNFIFNSQNVISTFNNDYTDGFKYVLPIYTGNTAHEIPVNTFRPAIYLRTYFDKILKEANFRYTFDEIQGDDKILHFNKILVPFLNKLGDIKTNLDIFNVTAESTYIANAVRDYNNTSPGRALIGKTPNVDVNYDVIIQDESGSWDGFQYIPQFNGDLNIKTKATITASVNNMNTLNTVINNRFSSPGVPMTPDGTIIGYFKLFYVINKNGVDIPNTSTFIGGIPIEAGTIVNSMDSVIIGTISGEVLSTVSVLSNDVIKIRVYGQLDSIPTQMGIYTSNSVIPLNQLDMTSPLIDINYEIEVTDNEIKFESNIQTVSQNFGSLIDINNFKPKKVKQSDFIKSILNAFQLFVIPDSDDDNLLHFITRDKFFDEGAKYDWTNYLIKDKEQTLVKLSQSQSKKKIFTYKEDKNPYNTTYTAETNEIYGQATFTFNDENIYDEDKIELIFSPSPYGYMREDNMYLTDMPEESGLRILYDAGVRSCVTNLVFDYTSSEINYGNYINQYPLSIHFNDEKNPTFDLNFSVCPLYMSKPESLTNNNLFNNYWRRTIHQLNEGYMLTAYFNLSENIVSSLKMNEKIYLENKWYNINQIIDYNPAKSNIVKVELITIDDGASTYKGLVVDNTKPGISRPNIDTGIVDVFIDNNVIVANPGRPNKGTGMGNIIIGYDNLIKGNSNIIEANGATVTGNNNEVKSSGIISGNNNIIEEGLNNVIVMGDNMTITQDNTIAVENLQVDNINGLPIPVGGIPSDFTDLNDTPNDYSTKAGQKVVVNPTEDGLDFIPDFTSSASILFILGNIRRAALTGDVTAPMNNNTTTIANNAVTNTKAADMPAYTIKGNNTSSLSDPKDLSVAEIKAMIETSSVAITQAELQIACNNGTVIPGQLYRLSDAENIVFKGITTTTVESQYVIIRAVKDEHYTMQSSGIVKGVYTPNFSYAPGNIVIWGGRCFIKGIGTQVSTVMPTDNLNINIGGTPTITNWEMILPSDNTYYQNMLIKVDADIHNDLIRGRYTGGNNNILGNYVSGGVLLEILRSDWGNDRIYNNDCYYIINNSNRQSNGVPYDIYYNSNKGAIYNNHNNGFIYLNFNRGNICKNSNSDDIYQNFNIGYINSNSNSGSINNNLNNGFISGNSNQGFIYRNINNGSVYDNSSRGDIYNNSNLGSILENSNRGNIYSNKNIGNINNSTSSSIAYNNNHIYNNVNNGQITVTFNAGSVACYNNINNGAIIRSTTVNIFDTINNKF